MYSIKQNFKTTEEKENIAKELFIVKTTSYSKRYNLIPLLVVLNVDQDVHWAKKDSGGDQETVDSFLSEGNPGAGRS